MRTCTERIKTEANCLFHRRSHDMPEYSTRFAIVIPAFMASGFWHNQPLANRKSLRP
ncbi:MAG: hypothetical protein GF353_01015 [Candidatus Lokiarchaeota archaeon]|nr:hypothetical protein [Candidatus Lokiarchaeota archaeon]